MYRNLTSLLLEIFFIFLMLTSCGLRTIKVNGIQPVPSTYLDDKKISKQINIMVSYIYRDHLKYNFNSSYLILDKTRYLQNWLKHNLKEKNVFRDVDENIVLTEYEIFSQKNVQADYVIKVNMIRDSSDVNTLNAVFVGFTFGGVSLKQNHVFKYHIELFDSMFNKLDDYKISKKVYMEYRSFCSPYGGCGQGMFSSDDIHEKELLITTNVVVDAIKNFSENGKM